MTVTTQFKALLQWLDHCFLFFNFVGKGVKVLLSRWMIPSGSHSRSTNWRGSKPRPFLFDPGIFVSLKIYARVEEVLQRTLAENDTNSNSSQIDNVVHTDAVKQINQPNVVSTRVVCRRHKKKRTQSCKVSSDILTTPLRSDNVKDSNSPGSLPAKSSVESFPSTSRNEIHSTGVPGTLTSRIERHSTGGDWNTRSRLGVGERWLCL